MYNELLIVILALFDILFVFVAARNGVKRLFGSIALNLILVTIFGSKLIAVFGFTTNIGNIFYACVFLATYFLLERQNKDETIHTIWFGLICLLFFVVLSQLAVNIVGINFGSTLDIALRTTFDLSIRVTIASALAFMFSQYANIQTYGFIKQLTKGKYLWIQAIGATIIAQLIDSCLFFTIAFLDMPGRLLVQTIITGWIVKIAVIVIAIPFFYIDKKLLKNKN